MTATSSNDGSRHLHEPPVGAVVRAGGTTSFRVWAPQIRELRLHLIEPDDRMEKLEPEEAGYHHVEVDGVADGSLYEFVMPDGAGHPDPASRSQPQGVHGPSSVFDPCTFDWNDQAFAAVPWWRSVIYEMHVGTFTADGTLDGATVALDHVVELGANTVELMPVAQFAGVRNWGYDGVFPFAVQNSYGGPRAMQRFVQACHDRNLSVILDVVYNHLGPEGNVLPVYGPYFTDRYRTPWGPAVNVDGPYSDEVRRYLVANALWWFTAFHVDGLRLDAVHEIVDTTARPFLLELVEATDALSETLGRELHLVAEERGQQPSSRDSEIRRRTRHPGAVGRRLPPCPAQRADRGQGRLLRGFRRSRRSGLFDLQRIRPARSVLTKSEEAPRGAIGRPGPRAPGRLRAEP